jgi:hypothetical protein
LCILYYREKTGPLQATTPHSRPSHEGPIFYIIVDNRLISFAIQRKTLHFAGAQVFRTQQHGLKVIEPLKKAQ